MGCRLRLAHSSAGAWVSARLQQRFEYGRHRPGRLQLRIEHVQRFEFITSAPAPPPAPCRGAGGSIFRPGWQPSKEDENQYTSSGSTPAPGVAGRALAASSSSRRCFPRGRGKQRPRRARSRFYFRIRRQSLLAVVFDAFHGRLGSFRGLSVKGFRPPSRSVGGRGLLARR